jgi:hypothetical protein
VEHCSTRSDAHVAISVQRFRYDLDTLRSESTVSLRTLQDPTPALSTGQNSVVVRCLPTVRDRVERVHASLLFLRTPF